MSLWGEIALDGARRSVTVEREYPATRAELWGALTEPERLARWIGAYYESRRTASTSRWAAPTSTRWWPAGCWPASRSADILVTWRFSGEGAVEADTELEAMHLGCAGTAAYCSRWSTGAVQAVTAAVYGAGWQDVLTHLARALGAEPTPQEADGYQGGAADPAAFDAALEEYRVREAALVAGETERVDGRSGVRLDACWMRRSTTSGTPSRCPTGSGAGSGR